jgi:hypothetical protein
MECAHKPPTPYPPTTTTTTTTNTNTTITITAHQFAARSPRRPTEEREEFIFEGKCGASEGAGGGGSQIARGAATR